ncbi:MAG: ABC transporter substrate-binding protein [Clostridia bacterium]|nr:ABC transporter substrate-binding protein [Clostridia bacterium]
MKHNKWIAILMAAAMLLSLCACGSQPQQDNTPADQPEPPTVETPAQPETPAESQTPEQPETPAEPQVDSELPIHVMTLNGTTGFGMAKLIADKTAGTAALNYNITVETDASNVTGALINGSVDIAALPTNAASVVYNKTQGAVQVLALNTLGVLYVVADKTENITSLADLEGKTVYAPAQNPTFIFQALCQKAGVNVEVDNSYAQPADLRTAVAAGEVKLAVLPEPMVTIACAGNENLTVALDLTAEWDAVYTPGSLVQGCVVVRKAFAEEHPAEVAKFLEEYEASINYLSEDTAAAAQLIVDAGIFAQAPVAQKAIPKCNLCFIAGTDMESALGEFLNIMAGVAAPSVGGAVPAADFYYVG